MMPSNIKFLFTDANIHFTNDRKMPIITKDQIIDKTSIIYLEQIMMEAFFENKEVDEGPLYLPFACHAQVWNGNPVMAEAHWHYDLEILYAIRGKATIFLNGHFYPMHEGDLILMSTREVHAIWGEAGTEYICIKFDPDILYTSSRSLFESRYVIPFTMARLELQKRFAAEKLSQTPLPRLIQEIYRENKKREYAFELAVRTHICQIFLWILRSWQAQGIVLDTSSYFKDKDRVRLQPVFDYIDDNYAHSIRAEDMSRLCNMSYSYFSRYFKSAVGKSFSAYLNHVRITEAEKLLLSSDRTITEVAMETGFSSPSYFISQFRRLKHVSPRQFRRELKNAHSDQHSLSLS